MFGVVPKRMWAGMNPPDVNNLCTWAMRTLLVETGNRKILIDTGIGNIQDDRFRSHFEPHGPQTLFNSLANAGVRREDITDVFLTHLHFDHCGGALWQNEETSLPELSFPNALYWTNEPHFKWATNPNPREKASFLPENFLPLQEQDRLRFIEVRQNIEFLPGFRVRFVYGHTEAMMVPVLDTGRGTVVYCADTIPSQWHVGTLRDGLRCTAVSHDGRKSRLAGRGCTRKANPVFRTRPGSRRGFCRSGCQRAHCTGAHRHIGRTFGCAGVNLANLPYFCRHLMHATCVKKMPKSMLRVGTNPCTAFDPALFVHPKSKFC